MTTAATHLVSGINGVGATLWPITAISRDSSGVFRDIRGRVVKAPQTRLGVALDTADGGRPAKRKAVGKDSDNAAYALVRRLLPTLRRMAAESEAEASDDMESENRDLFGAEAADEAASAYSEGMSAYAEAKAYWANVSKRNAERRGKPYSAIPPANRAQAAKGH